jgi:APA family basic amino acid/polyamine antiporter
MNEPESERDRVQPGGLAHKPQLARRIGAFDATMLVMGGIIGSGIFVNPYVVARQVHTPALILGAWVAGGLTALAGAFIYAELAVLRPQIGGQYAYLRDAYHPLIAFLYGWALLLVMQTGGMAAVAVTFVRYTKQLVNFRIPEPATAAAVLMLLSSVNCLGVVIGSKLQSLLMMVKIATIAGLIGIGFTARPVAALASPPELNRHSMVAFGAALVPVLFAYGGWQTASFMSGELREPRRDLARALLFGVIGVTVVYVAVNVVCVRGLGPAGLAATDAPVYTLISGIIGTAGARFMSFAIAVSTLGFLSQGMLTAPRVYFAMANDGLFFRSIGMVTRTTHAPYAAIVLQGLLASAIALAGGYEQILSYVVSIDFIFFGLTGLALYVFRRRGGPGDTFRTPLHPFTTFFFVTACWTVVIATFYHYPRNCLIGLSFLLAGIPIYFYWSRRATA